jgi:hypothetical protein
MRDFTQFRVAARRVTPKRSFERPACVRGEFAGIDVIGYRAHFYRSFEIFPSLQNAYD